MKLLHLIATTDRESGGPIEFVLRISEVMIRDGHDVEVASLEDELSAGEDHFPLTLTRLGRGRGRYGYNPRLIWWLKKNAHRFDAIVIHGMWNFISVGSWRALLAAKKPYFIFSHGMMDPWFRKANPLKHSLKQLYWLLWEGRVLRDAQAVLFTCDEEMIVSRNVFRGYNYSERVVRFGTGEPPSQVAQQKAAFAAAHPQLAERGFLLFLSRIHPKKGCDLLIEAFAANLPSLPPSLDLVIAGPDQLGWGSELKALAQRYGVAERVHWPGMLTGDIKWGAYRHACAMILPSHQENFGIVVAEAMACSTPVLISNKVNIWREVESTGAGLVAPDTLEGTTRLIRHFIGLSEPERAQMSRAGRSAFEHFFNIDAAARDLVRVIGRSEQTQPELAS